MSEYIQEPAEVSGEQEAPPRNNPPRPAWWPTNPYTAHSTGVSPNDAEARAMYDGWEMASMTIWNTMCEWFDACQVWHFEELKERIERRRYYGRYEGETI